MAHFVEASPHSTGLNGETRGAGMALVSYSLSCCLFGVAVAIYPAQIVLSTMRVCVVVDVHAPVVTTVCVALCLHAAG